MILCIDQCLSLHFDNVFRAEMEHINKPAHACVSHSHNGQCILLQTHN